MHIPVRHRSGDLGFNMTPMIDVVFLLIIFFLVSSHLAKQEAQLELPLPMAASGLPPANIAIRRLTLNVLAGGELRLAGRPISQGQLESRLQEAQLSSATELEVQIRSDRSVPYQAIEPLMLACTQAGIWNVTFGVLPRDIR